MAEHELEIEISPTGEVRARTVGVRGEGCLEYAKLIEAVVGQIAERELTADYHEPGPPVSVRPTVSQRR